MIDYSLEWYQFKYNNLVFTRHRIDAIEKVAKKIFANKERYLVIQNQTGVPWYMIGAIHNLESSLDFKGVLHNGEYIIGTNRQTTLVPRGRGPFASWEASAIDALKIKGYHDKSLDYWTLPRILQKCEAYNGLGYQKYHPQQKSPYIWACSNQCLAKGKYKADGVYSKSTKTDGQVGVATTLKMMQKFKMIMED